MKTIYINKLEQKLSDAAWNLLLLQITTLDPRELERAQERTRAAAQALRLGASL